MSKAPKEINPLTIPTPAAEMILDWRASGHGGTGEIGRRLSKASLPSNYTNLIQRYHHDMHPRNLSHQECLNIATAFDRPAGDADILWQRVQLENTAYKIEQKDVLTARTQMRSFILKLLEHSPHKSIQSICEHYIAKKMGASHARNIKLPELLNATKLTTQSSHIQPSSTNLATQAIPYFEDALQLAPEEKQIFRGLLQRLYPKHNVWAILDVVENNMVPRIECGSVETNGVLKSTDLKRTE